LLQKIFFKFIDKNLSLMILKITPKVNNLVKIAAIVQLSLFIFDSVIDIGHLNVPRGFDLVNYTVLSVLSILMAFYIIGILNFFDEKTGIKASFFIYAILEILIVGTTVLVKFESPKFSLILSSVLGLLIFLNSFYLVISSSRIRNKIISNPIMLFTISFFVVGILKMLISISFPLIFRASFETENRGVLLSRNALNWVSVLSVLTPVAIMLLISRVERCLNSQQQQ